MTTNGNIDKVGLRHGTELNTKWNPTAKLAMTVAWFIAEKFPTSMVEDFEKAKKEVGK